MQPARGDLFGRRPQRAIAEPDLIRLAICANIFYDNQIIAKLNNSDPRMSGTGHCERSEAISINAIR